MKLEIQAETSLGFSIDYTDNSGNTIGAYLELKRGEWRLLHGQNSTFVAQGRVDWQKALDRGITAVRHIAEAEAARKG